MLDIGAGTGALSHHLVAAGARVIAVRHWSLVAGRPLPRSALCRQPRADSPVLVIRRV